MISTLISQAVTAVFFLLLLLLGSAMILAPTIVLWLSLQRLWPTLFPVKVWQMTLLCVLLSVLSYGWLPLAAEQSLMEQSSQALLLTFGWTLCLIPLQALWQRWQRQQRNTKFD